MPLPGDPDAVRIASDQMAVAARALQAAHESVAAHGQAVVADWTGLAAPLALARVEQDVRDLQQAADAANRTVAPLAAYADELRAAQLDYARGESMLAHGRAALDGVGSGAVAAADNLREHGFRSVDDARSIMDAAEERALVANETAARALAAASSALPGGLVPTSPAAAPAAGGVGSTFAEMGNVAGSLGNAALRNPLDGLALLGGGALAAVGIAGAAASVPLDATGIGAVAGVPLGGASVAGIVGGAGIAGAGLLDLATHAATDNRVTPFLVAADSGEPAPAAFPPDAPREITGLTRHGQERAEGRDGHGVSDEAMDDAVANPVRPVDEESGGRFVYEGQHATVVLNSSGKVITTWAEHRTGWRYP
jgi:hypothetical protein